MDLIEVLLYVIDNIFDCSQFLKGLFSVVQLLLSCGAENTLTSVVELQKCEYQLTGTTPALCLPVEEDKNAPSKEEL